MAPGRRHVAARQRLCTNHTCSITLCNWQRLAAHALESQRWRLDAAMWQRECCRLSALQADRDRRDQQQLQQVP